MRVHGHYIVTFEQQAVTLDVSKIPSSGVIKGKDGTPYGFVSLNSPYAFAPESVDAGIRQAVRLGIVGFSIEIA